MDDRAAIYEYLFTPPKVYGIPRDYTLVVGAGALFAFITIWLIFAAPISSYVVAGLVGAALWGFGAVFAKVDAEFMTVRIIRILRLQSVSGRYEP